MHLHKIPEGVVLGEKAYDYGWNTISSLDSTQLDFYIKEIDEIFEESEMKSKSFLTYE